MLIFTCLQPITMAPYTHWALPSFRKIPVNHCDEYLNSTDYGTDKTCSKLITQVAKDITDIARQREEKIPDGLEKVISLHILLLIGIN